MNENNVPEAGVVFLLLGIIYLLFNRRFGFSIYGEAERLVKMQMPLPAKHKQILQTHCAYYLSLSSKDQLRFQKRVQRFICSKQFVPRGFKKVTDEMKVLISASATQLTFGLSPIYLAHFKRILIYPDSYYSQITRKYHVGEVNPKMGVIVLSWRAFIESHESNDDYNVGIHEMAHAIHLENRIRNEEFDFLDKRALAKLDLYTQIEMGKLNRGEPHLFRSYAGADEYEFFAVALECFFASPSKFKAQLPDLYNTLVALLNQDPENRGLLQG